jgi:hypothetical protein
MNERDNCYDFPISDSESKGHSMSEYRMLKISYNDLCYPMELFIATPLNARADEYV